jgi:hypothetical protein
MSPIYGLHPIGLLYLPWRFFCCWSGIIKTNELTCDMVHLFIIYLFTIVHMILIIAISTYI